MRHLIVQGRPRRRRPLCSSKALSIMKTCATRGATGITDNCGVPPPGATTKRGRSERTRCNGAEKVRPRLTTSLMAPQPSPTNTARQQANITAQVIRVANIVVAIEGQPFLPPTAQQQFQTNASAQDPLLPRQLGNLTIYEQATSVAWKSFSRLHRCCVAGNAPGSHHRHRPRSPETCTSSAVLKRRSQ